MNQIEYRRKRWGIYSFDYAKDHSRGETVEKEIFWIIKLLNPKIGEKIMDMGCNTGELCNILSKKYNVDVEGIDINKSAISIAKRKYPGVNFSVGNINTSKTNKKYDAIVMMQIIEHMENPEKTLKTVKHYLKKDGRIIISTPNKWAFVDKLKCTVLRKKFAYDPSHHNEFTPLILERLLKESGFRINRIITKGTAIIPFTEKLFGLGWKSPNWLIGSTIIVSARNS